MCDLVAVNLKYVNNQISKRDMFFFFQTHTMCPIQSLLFTHYLFNISVEAVVDGPYSVHICCSLFIIHTHFIFKLKLFCQKKNTDRDAVHSS